MQGFRSSTAYLHKKINKNNIGLCFAWLFSELRDCPLNCVTIQCTAMRGILWQYSDNHLTIPWQYSDNTLTILWQFSDNILTILWQFSDNTLTILWQYSDNTLTILWQFSDNTLTILWQYSDNSLTILWQYPDNSDNSLTILWQYSDNTLTMRALQYVRALPDILCIAWQIKQLNLLLTSVNCIARQSFVPRASHSLMGSPQCVCKTKQLYLLLTSVNCIARRSFNPRASHSLMGNPQCVCVKQNSCTYCSPLSTVLLDGALFQGRHIPWWATLNVCV